MTETEPESGELPAKYNPGPLPVVVKDTSLIVSGRVLSRYNWLSELLEPLISMPSKIASSPVAPVTEEEGPAGITEMNPSNPVPDISSMWTESVA